MEKIRISDHPVTGYIRYAEVVENGLSYRGNVIALVVEISSYKELDAAGIIIANQDFSLIADNTTCVDVNGTIVPCGSPEAAMTEYEYFVSKLDQPIILLDMYLFYIQRADAAGRFN
jgi:hypothetical protein